MFDRVEGGGEALNRKEKNNINEHSSCKFHRKLTLLTMGV
jgi:hypothetical protein